MAEQKTVKTEMEKSQTRAMKEPERVEERRVFLPATDIYEQKDALVVMADMPGVDEHSIDMDVERNVLTITGHSRGQEYEGHTLSYREYEQGDYQRSFTLSDEIDTEKIEATLKNGVLRIVLPKAEAAKPKKIAVKAE